MYSMFNDLVRTINTLSSGILDGEGHDISEVLKSYKCRGGNGSADDGEVPVVVPVIRTSSDDSGATVYFDIPGAKRETIEATIKDETRVLKVTAERADGSRKYSGTVSIGESYDLDAISTEYADGVLTVKVPKKEVKDGTRKLSIN